MFSENLSSNKHIDLGATSTSYKLQVPSSIVYSTIIHPKRNIIDLQELGPNLLQANMAKPPPIHILPKTTVNSPSSVVNSVVNIINPLPSVLNIANKSSYELTDLKSIIGSESKGIIGSESKEMISPGKKHKISELNPERGVPIHDISNVSMYDIGLHYNKKLSNYDVYQLVKNLWRPSEKFNFPPTQEGKKPKHFLPGWLDRFCWLAYSKYLDGAFCLPCVLFGRRTGHNSGKLDKLFNSPLTLWTSAHCKFSGHETRCKMHKSASVNLIDFMNNMGTRETAVNIKMNKVLDERIKKNHEKLKSIINCVLVFGQQNIAFCGRQDDTADIENGKEGNPGNFQAILDLMVRSGDKVLEEHFQTAPRNATYRSRTIQNQIISCCGKYILENIVDEIKKAGMFSILADETPDCANLEQMPVAIRFVDNNGVIREEFIQFVECDSGTSGNTITEKLLQLLQNLGLDIQNIRGQGYNGASNMSGSTAGVAKQIQKLCTLAVYIHCFAAHQLNLCIVASCKILSIKNMMDQVKAVTDFFNNSPKRMGELVKNIKNMTPEARHKKLLDPSKTRWIMCIDSLDMFEELYEIIMVTLEGMKKMTSWNDETRKVASSLFCTCTNFSFLLSLQVAKQFLGLLHPLSVCIEGREIGIVDVYKQVDLVLKGLEDASRNIEKVHDMLYKKAVRLGMVVNSEPKKPRTCIRQNYRENYSLENIEDYYRLSVTQPFLEHVIREIETRFDQESLIVLKGFYILPELLLNSCFTIGEWQSKTYEFCERYKNDLPSYFALDAELALWKVYWTEVNKEPIPKNVAETLKRCHHFGMREAFPNIYKILQILGTVPITSCECKQSVNILKHLNTYLPSTMTQDRLNGLALMAVHRNKSINVDKIIDMFAHQHERRLKLINILEDDED